MTKRVYINVFDKEGIVDYANDLYKKFDYEIVSAGSTFDLLKNSGIPVVEISSLSALDEFCNRTSLEDFVKKYFSMIIVNLQPVNEIASQTDDVDKFMSEIDINGFAVVRAGAKYYNDITVVIDKADFYSSINTTSFDRMKLSIKAFGFLENYDGMVSAKLIEYAGGNECKKYSFEKISQLKYGANPHQRAGIYKFDHMVDYELLSGSELSYNDIQNLTTAANLMSEFFDVNASAVVKHGVPCGVALGRSIYEAYTKAFDCDPFASFFGTIAFSKSVDFEVAKHLGSMSVKVVLAPDYDEDALDLLKESTDAKLVKLNTPLKDYKKIVHEDISITPFGILIQDKNRSELDKDLFKVVTKVKPTAEQIEDAIFAWKIAKSAKTNAIVVAKDFKTSAITQGQTSAAAAIELAMDVSCENSKDSILASDEALQTGESLNPAVQGRISLIIQPGGSIRDREVIAAADKFGIAMVMTGVRNLRF